MRAPWTSPRLAPPWAVVVLAALGACRPDPGVPDYSAMGALFGDGGVTALPGPNPYVPGTRRLAFGIFYEGASSDTLPLDSYFIFSNSYTTVPSDLRVEGLQSDELDFNGTPFWGGGIFWDRPTDLSGWATLHVSLRSADPGLAQVAVRMISLSPAPASQERTFEVSAADHGWSNDGQWHTLAIPLSAFTAQGLDLARMRSPFTIGNLAGGGTAALGETLLVDDLYVD